MGRRRRVRQHEEMPANRIISFYAKALFGIHIQLKNPFGISAHKVQAQADVGDEQAIVVYKYKSELREKKR